MKWLLLHAPVQWDVPATTCSLLELLVRFSTSFYSVSNTILGRYKVAFDYDGPEEPCSGRYGDYNCMYDAVYDFKVKKLFKGSSVIKGQ